MATRDATRRHKTPRDTEILQKWRHFETKIDKNTLPKPTSATDSVFEQNSVRKSIEIQAKTRLEIPEKMSGKIQERSR